MKHTWIAYAVTGLLAAGAGVAIAGLPSDVPNDVVIDALPPSSTAVPATTSTTPSTTVAPTTTTRPRPSTTTSTTSSTSTTSTTDAVPSTTEDVDDGLIGRGELAVGVANATDQAGVAGSRRDLLLGLGYVDVTSVDASPEAISRVFHADGLDAEASRLATDAGLPATAIAPIGDAPVTSGTRVFQLLIVIGLDQVS